MGYEEKDQEPQTQDPAEGMVPCSGHAGRDHPIGYIIRSCVAAAGMVGGEKDDSGNGGQRLPRLSGTSEV